MLQIKPVKEEYIHITVEVGQKIIKKNWVNTK